jgi:hypothetical protein
MTYLRDLDVPARYPSEASSAPSQSENCGVTVAAAIADFYWDDRHHIEQGRWLISGMGPYNVNGRVYYGCPPQTPTNAWQQADMLRRRGIPCTVVLIRTVSQIHQIVDSGRRPMLLGLNFAYVPDATAGHMFQGWHAIKVRDGDASVGNFIVNDPNFWHPDADATNGKRWNSDAVKTNALNATGGAYGVGPNAAKVVALPSTSAPPPSTELDDMWELFVHEHRGFNIIPGSTLYKGPGRQFPEHLHSTPGSMQRQAIGYIELPNNAGLWRCFPQIDGVGVFWVANSRVRAVA